MNSTYASDDSPAARLDAATPPDRDRYADLVRLFSIGMVAVGHWVVALLTLHGAGTVSTSMPLMLSTWVWQVMALFFFVGGFAHARALRHDPPTGAFVRARAARLLPPAVAMLAIWTLVTAAFDLLGLRGGEFALGLHTITVPLWFLGVYLVIVLAAPAMMRLHRRFGLWPVVAALAAATAGTDALRFALDQEFVGYANMLFVWLAVHQLGYGYADGTLSRRTGAVLTLGGLAATIGLVFGTSRYPVLMVGLPGNETANSAPPTLALLAQSLFLVGLALLLRRVGTAFVARARVWLPVAGGNQVIMTIFCWHLSACYLVQGALLATGARLPAADTPVWFAALAGWLIACSVVCAGLVAGFRRFEAVRTVGTGRYPVVGLLAAAVGLFTVSRIGLDGLMDGRPAGPLVALLLVAAGYRLLNGSAR
jgi:hypothetical protein